MIKNSSPLELAIRVELLSLKPIRSVEVVVNGAVHTLQLKPEAKENSYRGSLSLTTQTAAWVTARWVESRGNSCDAAHTSPVYVRGVDQHIPLDTKYLDALLTRVEQTIRDMDEDAASDRIVIDSDATRKKTLQFLERARDSIGTRSRTRPFLAIGTQTDLKEPVH